MKLDDFEQLVTTHPVLASHAEFLRGMLKPCVRIQVTDQLPRDAQSRFGGIPLLPPGFAWPQHEVGVYRFLAQIDFSEIANRPESLQEAGLLVLFYAEYAPDSDGEEEIFWGDEGYVKAAFFEDPAMLVATPPPRGKAVPGRRILLTGEWDLPRHSDLRKGWPLDSEVLDGLLEDPGAMYGKPSSDALLPTDYLLGYPSYYSLGYDPTPGPQWVSLLTLHSHDAFEWCWHDGDKLMVFIEQDRLAARDFGALQCDAG